MFIVGILLFVASAVYGAIEQSPVAWLFGGLGVATFVSLFLLRPIERSQKALTNLVQVEMGFIGFNEQLSLLQEGRWRTSRAHQSDPDRLQLASQILQDRTEGSMELLQRYVGIGGGNPNQSTKDGSGDAQSPVEHAGGGATTAEHESGGLRARGGPKGEPHLPEPHTDSSRLSPPSIHRHSESSHERNDDESEA
jgi:hypothetical protein